MDATILGPGEGEQLTAGASSIAIKATAATTGGGLFLSESTVPPGFPGPPPHTHERMTDCFHVLEGTLVLCVGDAEHEAPAGTFASIPPGVVHTFRNDGDAPVRLLNLSTPGGWEASMRDLAALMAGGDFDPAAVRELAARHDLHVA